MEGNVEFSDNPNNSIQQAEQRYEQSEKRTAGNPRQNEQRYERSENQTAGKLKQNISQTQQY